MATVDAMHCIPQVLDVGADHILATVHMFCLCGLKLLVGSGHC